MSSLIKQVLSQGDFGWMQSTALIIFVLLMVAVSVWIFLPGAKDYYERIASDITEG